MAPNYPISTIADSTTGFTSRFKFSGPSEVLDNHRTAVISITCDAGDATHKNDQLSFTFFINGKPMKPVSFANNLQAFFEVQIPAESSEEGSSGQHRVVEANVVKVTVRANSVSGFRVGCHVVRLLQFCCVSDLTGSQSKWRMAWRQCHGKVIRLSDAWMGGVRRKSRTAFRLLVSKVTRPPKQPNSSS